MGLTRFGPIVFGDLRADRILNQGVNEGRGSGGGQVSGEAVGITLSRDS